jgi:tight adherence protein B
MKPPSSVPADYRLYKMTVRQRMFQLLASGGAFYMIGYIFYSNHTISLLMIGLVIFRIRAQNNRFKERRKHEIGQQFRYALNSIASLLSAGKSVENAFIGAVADLKLMYLGKAPDIVREIEMMNRKVENGIPIERALAEFSVRTESEDIANFAEVFSTCRRTGGDLTDVIRRTAAMIAEKMEIQQEIRVLIARKKFEANMLAVIPFAIIGVLRFSSPEYMASLNGLTGYMIMTVVLMALLFSGWATKRIMDIKV